MDELFHNTGQRVTENWLLGIMFPFSLTIHPIINSSSFPRALPWAVISGWADCADGCWAEVTSEVWNVSQSCYFQPWLPSSDRKASFLVTHRHTHTCTNIWGSTNDGSSGSHILLNSHLRKNISSSTLYTFLNSILPNSCYLITMNLNYKFYRPNLSRHLSRLYPVASTFYVSSQ